MAVPVQGIRVPTSFPGYKAGLTPACRLAHNGLEENTMYTFSIIGKDGRTSCNDPRASAKAYMARLSFQNRPCTCDEVDGEYTVKSPGLMTLIFVPTEALDAYGLAARVIRERIERTRDHRRIDELEEVAVALADIWRRTQEGFDRDEFLRACKVQA